MVGLELNGANLKKAESLRNHLQESLILNLYRNLPLGHMLLLDFDNADKHARKQTFRRLDFGDAR